MNKNEILIELSESEKINFGKQNFGENFAEQPIPKKVFASIWWLESEVNNGGFSQYFLNGSAASAPFVVWALEQIGAPRTAEICERAITRAFPKGLPPSPESIQSEAGDFADDVLDKLGHLDEEFFAYPHDLTALLFAYARQHPEEFGPLPEPSDA